QRLRCVLRYIERLADRPYLSNQRLGRTFDRCLRHLPQLFGGEAEIDGAPDKVATDRDPARCCHILLRGAWLDDDQGSKYRTKYPVPAPPRPPRLLLPPEQPPDYLPVCAGGLIVIGDPSTSPPTATPPGAVTV